MTYYTERAADRMAYITLFPIGGTMRANMFVYRDMDDPWLKQIRDQPQRDAPCALAELARRSWATSTVAGFVQIRPVDLYVTKGYRQHGVVLVGDAFSSSCPAAGTGARKVLTDVERLCNVHIPRWLATPGMGEAKIAAFYDDPVKRACDTLSDKKAFRLRSYSIDTAPHSITLRWAKFMAIGVAACCGASTPSPRLPSAAFTTRLQEQTAPWVRTRRCTNSTPLSWLLLNAEADRRPMIDASGIVRRRADVERRRAFEIVGVIAERQL